MPNISTLSPIKLLPLREEVSALRSPRDSQTIYHNWKYLNELGKGYNKLIQIANQMTREIKRIEGHNVLGFDFFPFCIYTVPLELRPPDSGSYTSGYNWSTVRVRGGAVLINSVNTGSSWVYGTDQSLYPDYSTLTFQWQSPIDIIVPPGSNQYWFWVEQLSSSVSGSMNWLQYATSSAITTTGVQTPWASWPSASFQHIPIGYVDNVTNASVQDLLVRQFQRTDITQEGTTSGSYIPMNICINGVMETVYVNAYSAIQNITNPMMGAILSNGVLALQSITNNNYYQIATAQDSGYTVLTVAQTHV